MFIARIRTVINGLVHEPSTLPPAAHSAKPLAMVPLEDLRDRNAAIFHLEEKVVDTIKSSSFRIMMLEAETEEKLSAARKKMDEAVAERAQTELETASTLAQTEKAAKESRERMEATHMLAAEELEASYERRLAIEAARFKRLQDEVTDYKFAMEEKVQAMRRAHETLQAKSEQVGQAGKRATGSSARRFLFSLLFFPPRTGL